MKKYKVDIIKALRCLASQDPEGDCYMNKYNYMHFNDGVRMRCGSDCSENEIVCPYYQQTYGTCFYDGECSGFLKKAADLLEKD